MFDKGIMVTAIDDGTVYSKGGVFISYGIHPEEKEYFAIKFEARYKRQFVMGHICDGLVPEGDGWWVIGNKFIEVEEEN